MTKLEYEFWMATGHGIVRRRWKSGIPFHPEVWRDDRWHQGSPYVMDAIIGMGEDPYSCGEWADPWTFEQAAQYASENDIDLFADNADDPYPQNESMKPKITKPEIFNIADTPLAGIPTLADPDKFIVDADGNIMPMELFDGDYTVAQRKRQDERTREEEYREILTAGWPRNLETEARIDMSEIDPDLLLESARLPQYRNWEEKVKKMEEKLMQDYSKQKSSD